MKKGALTPEWQFASIDVYATEQNDQKALPSKKVETQFLTNDKKLKQQLTCLLHKNY